MKPKNYCIIVKSMVFDGKPIELWMYQLLVRFAEAVECRGVRGHYDA